MTKRIAFINMAFGKVTETKESNIKLYTGVAPMYVRMVNPSKKQIEDFYGITLEKDPEYLGKTEAGESQIRIDLYLQSTDKVLNESGEPLDFKTKMSFFITDKTKVSQSGKIQVINQYGESSFVTRDCLDTKTMPDNQSWFSTDGLRAAYDGEAELVSFIKTYLNIPVKSWKGQDGVIHENPAEDAQCSFDHIDQWFKGNIKELEEVVAMQPNNYVQVLFGVKTNDNGSFQTAYTRMFLKASVKNYAKLEENVTSSQNAGAYPNTIFEICPLHEYVMQPTSFKTPQQTESSSAAPSPWAHRN